ncbi:hypothetical protein AAHB53_00745 [Niallia circulans]
MDAELTPERVKWIFEHTIRDFVMLHDDFTFEIKLDSLHLYEVSEQHLQQITTILLDNAVKYSVHEKIFFCIRMKKTTILSLKLSIMELEYLKKILKKYLTGFIEWIKLGVENRVEQDLD